MRAKWKENIFIAALKAPVGAQLKISVQVLVYLEPATLLYRVNKVVLQFYIVKSFVLFITYK